ncbi:hypothetical protein SAMN02745866_02269 [Alteromonadaceae bacterium Bs31]|nr:hypothetical protein SAMN02745866_02269 [Alteromonadaceae bacterium Bs31]
MSDWPSLIENLAVNPCYQAIADTEQGEGQAWSTPLSEHQLLVIQGADAVKFLQGQCTCDFSRLEKNEWLLGAHCNAKGRMHSSFTAAALGTQTIGLKVHRSIADTALAALKKYIVFSKADITLSTAPIVGVYLEKNSTHIPGTDLLLPEVGSFSLHGDQPAVLRLDENRCELWFYEEQQFKPLWQSLINTTSLTSPAFWHWLNIKAGRAEVCGDMVEKLIPQELNYQLIDGISFSKGCYTGQEIIARMHYKAALKKHLYRCGILFSPEQFTPKFESLIKDGKGKKVGIVIDYEAKSAEHGECLALINDDVSGDEDLIFEQESQAKLSWLALPYAIPK